LSESRFLASSEIEEVRYVEIHVGDAVTFVDPLGYPRPALVTAVWGAEVYDLNPPSINVVFVSGDENKHDKYGQQTEHETSVVHRNHQQAHGNFWFTESE